MEAGEIRQEMTKYIWGCTLEAVITSQEGPHIPEISKGTQIMSIPMNVRHYVQCERHNIHSDNILLEVDALQWPRWSALPSLTAMGSLIRTILVQPRARREHQNRDVNIQLLADCQIFQNMLIQTRFITRERLSLRPRENAEFCPPRLSRPSDSSLFAQPWPREACQLTSLRFIDLHLTQAN
jgi:hypothetical protein